jgi:hypothetical protein
LSYFSVNASTAIATENRLFAIHPYAMTCRVGTRTTVRWCVRCSLPGQRAILLRCTGLPENKQTHQSEWERRSFADVRAFDCNAAGCICELRSQPGLRIRMLLQARAVSPRLHNLLSLSMTSPLTSVSTVPVQSVACYG